MPNSEASDPPAAMSSFHLRPNDYGYPRDSRSLRPIGGGGGVSEAIAASAGVGQSPSPTSDDVEDGSSSLNLREAAPRLSLSSSGSSVQSEVRTPESAHVSPNWTSTHGGRAQLKEPLSLSSSSSSSSQNLVRPSNAVRHRDPSLSPPIVDYSGRSDLLEPANKALLEAARTMDDEELDEAQNHFSSTTASTLRSKRPQAPLRLPSSSGQTDATARPSPPSTNSNRSSAAQTPAASTSLGDLQTQSNGSLGSLGSSETARQGRSTLSPPSRSAMQQASSSSSYPFPDSMWSGQQPAAPTSPAESDSGESRDSVGQSLPSPRAPSHPMQASPLSTSSSAFAPVASPDSWRSLLPSHDPFYVSSEELARKPSIASIPMSSDTCSVQESADSQHFRGHVPAERRFSNASQASTFSSYSLPGPTAMPVSSSSSYAPSVASSSGDLDNYGIFTSGSRAAFAPLHRQLSESLSAASSLAGSETGHHGPLASRGVASDTGHGASDARDAFAKNRTTSSGSAGNGDFLTKAAAYENSLTQLSGMARRHASFSTFDQSSKPATSAKAGRPRVLATSHVPFVHSEALRTPLSPSSALAGDGDRERWPSSRNSTQSLNFNTEQLLAQVDRSSPELVDTNEPRVEYCIRDGMSPTSYAVAEPLSKSMTSPSVQAYANPQATDGPSTTTTMTTYTTLTTTTTTTTVTQGQTQTQTQTQTQVRSSATSPPLTEAPRRPQPLPLTGQGLTRSASLMAPAMGSDYQVSAFSPPSLPFLDPRPAPPSTDLTIETFPKHYLLKTTLPGFELAAITLATQHHRQLLIVADKYDEEHGGHFERRVTFGADVNLRKTRAQFDGTVLYIQVPKKDIVEAMAQTTLRKF